jgi:eukaryotic-like serine/threonine-protein kinase
MGRSVTCRTRAVGSRNHSGSGFLKIDRLVAQLYDVWQARFEQPGRTKSSPCMPTDRSFLYGVVALQAGLIDSQQFNKFIEACAEWNEPRDGPFPDLLITRGWIRSDDRAHLDYLVERKLQQHAGDAKSSLATVTHEVERSLVILRDDATQRSLGVSGGLESRPPSMAGVEPTPQSDDSRYTLIALHAIGGIGQVWLAHDVQMGRDVALKELRVEQAEDAVLSARFHREAQITGQLEHPGIVPVYEVARQPGTGRPFYTMRFVKGRTLSDVAKAYHQKRASGKVDLLEFSTLLNAFVVVCKTVAYAHSRGVIHRDLKGQNVIVGDFGEVVVLDWGLAKLVNRTEDELPMAAMNTDFWASGKVDLTMQGETLGTPAYMAPEQAAGRVDLIDYRTDVYGLGAMLYQLLTGEPPFSGGGIDDLLRKVRSEEPVSPQQRWAEVPLTLQAACLRALAKQPSDRFASAGELAQEVEHWQEVQRQQAIEALRHSQALYHSLVESIPLCVWRKDCNGRFTFANNSFSEAFGIKPEEMIGKTDSDFFPADLVRQIRSDDDRVLRTGETLRVTEEQRTPHGPRSVEVIKIPIRNSQGEIIGTQGIFWDITVWKPPQQESLAKKQ